MFLAGSIFLLNSCSSNNTTGGQVNPNSVGTLFTFKYEITLFTFKYEITTCSPVVSNPASQGIGYTNGTQ